ncbi:hypothetical protein ACJX0J_040414, partial [Zea mays]
LAHGSNNQLVNLFFLNDSILYGQKACDIQLRQDYNYTLKVIVNTSKCFLHIAILHEISIQ